jgi:thiol-disulfide isomerase/thioredoxin
MNPRLPATALAALLACGAANGAAAAAPQAQAQRAPARVGPAQLATAAQLRKALAKYRGQVIVLNFWATWCTPCLREIPDFLALEQELAPRGLKLLGVSMNEPAELAGVVEPFRRQYFPAFATYLRNEPDMDSIASVVDAAWNEILPTTWVLGRDGRVVAKIQGRKTREEFRALFESALRP